MMSVIVTTPATERRLTSVSAVVERYCGRIFGQQIYSEVVNGTDTDTLMVTHTPIIGTPTVTCDGSPITDFEVRDAEGGMLYRQVGWGRGEWVGWNVERDYTTGMMPRFTIAYTAGYKLPGEEDTTLPEDIEEATIITVLQWVKRDARDLDIKSKKVGDTSLTYGGDSDQAGIDASAIPPMARALLPRRIV